MVFGFQVRTPRSCGFGVVNDPISDDPPAGIAHALIQCEAVKPERSRRREIAEALAEAAIRYHPPLSSGNWHG